jgi:hypothetical protein
MSGAADPQPQRLSTGARVVIVVLVAVGAVGPVISCQ